MWEHFGLLFLFFFNALFIVSINFHHVNEVFNSISHDHLYHVTRVDLVSEDVYFDQEALTDVVADHFVQNLKGVSYDYVITFYCNGAVASASDLSKFLTINLQAPLGFFVRYDKTFSYYLT